MKKILSLLLLTVLMIAICSCGVLPEGKTDEESAVEALDGILEGIENNDPEAIKALFAKRTVYKQEDFDSDIAALIDFFEGEFVSRSTDGANVSWGMPGGGYTIGAYYEIETTEQSYVILFFLCLGDSKDLDKIGIETLRIVKAEDYTHSMDPGSSKPGLYIGPPFDNTPTNFSTIGKKHTENLVAAIEEKDSEKILGMFSENTLAELKSIDKDIEKLFEYYEGSAVKYTESVWGKYTETPEENGIKKTGSFYYDVKTTEGTYRITMDFCLNYEDEAAAGMTSLYILEADDSMNLKIPYRGDRKGTPGINIGVENLIM